MLRKAIRERRPGLELGGWANPHKDPARQVAYLVEARVVTDFYLTQVVSHHDLQPVERFLTEVERQRLDAPGLFGVFYYRSPNHRTLDALAPFLPVPRTALEREFREGATATGICARTIRALRTLGVRNVYVSNLPVGRAPHVLRDVLDHLRGQDGG